MLTEIIPGHRYLRVDGVEVEAYCDGSEDTNRIAVRPVNPRENDGLYRWMKSGTQWNSLKGNLLDKIPVAGRTLMSDIIGKRQDHLQLTICLTTQPKQEQLDLFE
jgi:hypothetical protein